MRYDTMFKPTFTAEYWDYTAIADATFGTITNYFKVDDREFRVTNEGSGVFSVFAYRPLRFNAQLRNVKDDKGVLLWPGDGVNEFCGYVGSPEAVLNVFGQVAGYRHTLRMGVV